jgi:hypothetical protein
MNNSIVFRCTGEVALGAVATSLQRRGLRVIRSFDLQTARGAVAGCTCPHHGTEHCTCEYFVLLAYGSTAAPAVITVHGRDARLCAQLVDQPGTVPEPDLAGQVEAGLLEAAFTLAAAAVPVVPCGSQ